MVKCDIENAPSVEHGYFSILVSNMNGEFEIINTAKVGTSFEIGLLDKLSIPKKAIFKLLKQCSECRTIPMVSHTHVLYGEGNDLSFSVQDMNFIKSFCRVGNVLGNIEKYVFFVTNGKYYDLIVVCRNGKENRKRGENEEIFNKGLFYI